MLPCLASAIHILMAKCTLPFQRSWWGQRQGAVSAWGVGMWVRAEGLGLSSVLLSWLTGTQCLVQIAVMDGQTEHMTAGHLGAWHGNILDRVAVEP